MQDRDGSRRINIPESMETGSRHGYRCFPLARGMLEVLDVDRQRKEVLRFSGLLIMWSLLSVSLL